jgi:hypothetical protein
MSVKMNHSPSAEDLLFSQHRVNMFQAMVMRLDNDNIHNFHSCMDDHNRRTNVIVFYSYSIFKEFFVQGPGRV